MACKVLSCTDCLFACDKIKDEEGSRGEKNLYLVIVITKSIDGKTALYSKKNKREMACISFLL